VVEERSNIKAGVRLILMGPPGSGKGTQGKLLSEHYMIPHLSTGEILRSEVERATDLGKEISATMDRGDLVSDKLMNQMVAERLMSEDCKSGYVLDGYPRTESQADSLYKVLCEHGEFLTAAIYLKIPDEVIVERLTKRAKDEGRVDDNEVTIRNRVEVYNKLTVPLFKYYENHSLFYELDGLGKIDQVFQRLKNLVCKLGSKALVS